MKLADLPQHMLYNVSPIHTLHCRFLSLIVGPADEILTFVTPSGALSQHIFHEATILYSSLHFSFNHNRTFHTVETAQVRHSRMARRRNPGPARGCVSTRRRMEAPA